MAQKMSELDVIETSGVDHPAHLVEGWVVMKQSDREGVADLISALAEPETITEGIDNVEQRVEELTKALEDAQAEIADLRAQIEAEPVVEEDPEEAMLKSVPEPVREMLEKARAEADEVKAELQAAKDAEADRAFIAKAAGWEHLALEADKIGPMLRVLADANPELEEMIAKALETANSQNEAGAIFEEIGKATGETEAPDAWAVIQSRANELVEQGRTTSLAKAIAIVADEDQALYDTYLTEKGI